MGGLVTIQNGESGLDVRNALNSMFATLFSSIPTPVIIENVHGNTEIVGVPGNSFIDSIGINASNDTTFQIGTTSGGQDILSSTELLGFQLFVTQVYLPTTTNIFITFTSGSGPVNFRFNIINNYL